jgi:hypothetical protein
MAFVAEVGRILNKPVILLADNRELIPKYAASGWVANGEEGGKAKMVLTIENIGRPASLEFKGQTKGVHWKWESTNTIEKFLEDGTQ